MSKVITSQITDSTSQTQGLANKLDKENNSIKDNKQRRSCYNYEDYKKLNHNNYNYGGLGPNFSESWQKK